MTTARMAIPLSQKSLFATEENPLGGIQKSHLFLNGVQERMERFFNKK
jgi:hypothetical protein